MSENDMGDINYWTYLSSNTGNEHYEIITPIKKIDGITDCSVNIEISKGGDLYITVSKYYAGNMLEFQKLIYQYTGEDRAFDDDYMGPNTDFYKAIITNIEWEDIFSYILNNIKFNKTLCKFVDYTATDEDLQLMGYDISECSVCYESTISICQNSHHTCIECKAKIKKQVAHDNYRCPICRVKF